MPIQAAGEGTIPEAEKDSTALADSDPSSSSKSEIHLRKSLIIGLSFTFSHVLRSLINMSDELAVLNYYCNDLEFFRMLT